MFAFLHLYFLSSGYKFFIESYIRDAVRATLAHYLEGVASACDNVSGEVDSTLNDSDCAFNWSFDKAFRGLIDDFPGSFSEIPD